MEDDIKELKRKVKILFQFSFILMVSVLGVAILECGAIRFILSEFKQKVDIQLYKHDFRMNATEAFVEVLLEEFPKKTKEATDSLMTHRHIYHDGSLRFER